VVEGQRTSVQAEGPIADAVAYAAVADVECVIGIRHADCPAAVGSDVSVGNVQPREVVDVGARTAEVKHTIGVAAANGQHVRAGSLDRKRLGDGQLATQGNRPGKPRLELDHVVARAGRGVADYRVGVGRFDRLAKRGHAVERHRVAQVGDRERGGQQVPGFERLQRQPAAGMVRNTVTYTARSIGAQTTVHGATPCDMRV